ncbi:EF-hand domain-containing protein [Nocardia transvalensis]|uniref:EF-hand domain-containing protein n=1 Tax=Nocardia transvalensis TaxID=37333 RepID=UPI001893B2DF|nr:EF-hand domain-containing protein [Nocardia transvalensis]MBF6329803.1 EF-hand domain-containing protein [Nocardia transvalensis]
MGSALRTEEYEMLFDAFDTDRDGLIGQVDIDVLVQRWCVALHVPPGTPAWSQITRKANRLWQDLIGHFDEAGDKRVSKQEWVASHDQPGFIENAAIPWAVGVFDVGDPEGEGRVSLQAWMTCQTVTGWGQVESLDMFLQLDDDRDGYVQRDRFVAYIEEFYSNAEDSDRWWSARAEA